jgi:hypothetical protein
MTASILPFEEVHPPILLGPEEIGWVSGGLPPWVCAALGAALLAGQEEFLPLFIFGCTVIGTQ